MVKVRVVDYGLQSVVLTEGTHGTDNTSRNPPKKTLLFEQIKPSVSLPVDVCVYLCFQSQPSNIV